MDLRQFSSWNDLTIFCFPIINQKILYKLSLDPMMTLDIFDLQEDDGGVWDSMPKLCDEIIRQTTERKVTTNGQTGI